MTYVTYILRCSDNSYYVGHTQDLGKRLRRHRRGEIRFTKNRLPIKVVLVEKYSTRGKAIKRELQIKKWKDRKAIETLIDKSKMAVSSSLV